MIYTYNSQIQTFQKYLKYLIQLNLQNDVNQII